LNQFLGYDQVATAPTTVASTGMSGGGGGTRLSGGGGGESRVSGGGGGGRRSSGGGGGDIRLSGGGGVVDCTDD